MLKKHIVIALFLSLFASSVPANAASLCRILGIHDEKSLEQEVFVTLGNRQQFTGIASAAGGSQGPGCAAITIPACGMGTGFTISIDFTINILVNDDMSSMPMCGKPVTSACGCSGF